MPYVPRSLALELDLFWLRVDLGGPRQCWDWLGGTDPYGYGRFTFQGKRWRTSRLMWFLTEGSDPGELFVCHACDRPICVNPFHLWLGTGADNMQDMSRKGRSRPGISRGAANGSAKLSVPQVLEIKSALLAGDSQTSLAARYGVSKSQINFIHTGRSWAHVSLEQ